MTPSTRTSCDAHNSNGRRLLRGAIQRARVDSRHPEIFAGWIERSAQTRASNRCELDISYGPDAMQTLDVFPCNHLTVIEALADPASALWRGALEAMR